MATMVAISDFWYGFLTFLAHFLTKMLSFVQNTPFLPKKQLPLPNETHDHVHHLLFVRCARRLHQLISKNKRKRKGGKREKEIPKVRPSEASGEEGRSSALGLKAAGPGAAKPVEGRVW